MTDDRSSLEAVSPLDGRYARYTGALVSYVSEAALVRARARVEVEYLLALADCESLSLELAAGERESLQGIYEDFSVADARRIKRIETGGTDGRAATNHDVKAIEYFLRDAIEDSEIAPWIHFGLTSEDVNNLAYRLLVKEGVREVLLPELDAIRERLAELARENHDLSMLARTHGQPATPTTFGKEMAVYGTRLDDAIDRIEESTEELGGKLAGASGTYAAHSVAAPEIDWRAFSREFVEGLGLRHLPLTTQVNPCDDLADLFAALRGANAILLDLDRDAWLYVSQGYLLQSGSEGETGSSTMPHKVNPIDFENSEGNLEKASSDLAFLAETLTTSRLQRDLSDSTVKRTIGTTLAHCLVGYRKLGTGLTKIEPDAERMAADLEAHPEVLGEAIQTVLRRAGHTDAYERLKDHTRGQRVTRETLSSILDDPDLELDEETRERLGELTPAEYTGLASELVDDLNDLDDLDRTD
ncbi:adenylosuccinate lyase [Halobacteriales archaeon QS_3_64_16]|nr:MAG: adenylosuccinate lyase [Halobacteriales archaeon QS_3_64_16]